MKTPPEPLRYCQFIFRGRHEYERYFYLLTEYRESAGVASGDSEEKSRRKVKM